DGCWSPSPAGTTCSTLPPAPVSNTSRCNGRRVPPRWCPRWRVRRSSSSAATNSSRWASQSRALWTLGDHGVLTVGDVREEVVGEPKAGDLLGDLRTLGVDEGDPVPAVADAEFFDLGER